MYLPVAPRQGLGNLTADALDYAGQAYSGALEWRGVVDPQKFFTQAAEIPGQITTRPARVLGFVAVPILAMVLAKRLLGGRR